MAEKLNATLRSSKRSWQQLAGTGRSADIVGASLAQACARLVSLLVPLITMPWTVTYLGQERFGIWMAASSIVLLISLVEGGVSSALVTATSRAHAIGDFQRIRHLIASAFALLIPVAIGFLAVVALIAIWTDWASLFKIKSTIGAAEAPQVFFTIAAITAISFFVNVGTMVRTGLQQIPLVSLWEVLGKLIALPALAIAIMLKMGTPWLVGALFGVPIVISGIGVIQFFASNPVYRPRLYDASWEYSRGLLHGGGAFTAATFAYLIAISSDQFLIAAIVSADAVTSYSILSRLFAIPFLLTSFVFFAQWPAYASSMARGDEIWVFRSFYRTLVAAIAFSLLLTLILIGFLEKILDLWMGQDIHTPALLVWGMGIYAVLSVAEAAIRHLLFALDARKELIGISVAMVLINVPLTIVLLHSIGVAGAVLATDIAYFCCIIIPSAAIICRRLLRYASEYK